MPGILLATGYTALLLYLMRRMSFFRTVPGLPLQWIGWLFLLKIAAGTALWAIYTYVYTERIHADVFKYFDDSAVMFDALRYRPGDFLRMLFSVNNDNAWFDERYYKVMNNWYREYESNLHNDAHTIIRYNAVVRLFSFGEFHVHTVFTAFLALTGMLGLYRAFVRMLPGRERALAFAVFLLPSVLFWASGVIKESLLFFGLGMLLWQLERMRTGRMKPLGLLILAGCMVLLFHLKFYVLMSLLPALAMLLLARWVPRFPLAVRTATVLLAFVLLGLNLHHLVPGFDVLETIAVKQRDFIGLAQATNSGSFVMPERLEANIWSFLQQAPYAVFITLLGPLVYMAPGAMGMVSAAENAVIIVLLTVLLMYRLPWDQVQRSVVVALLSYVTLLACVIGWTTPVMGAIVRYRTPMLPFLFIIALLVFDHHKALARWPRLKPFFSA